VAVVERAQGDAGKLVLDREPQILTIVTFSWRCRRRRLTYQYCLMNRGLTAGYELL
jgi:hypothetical protein